MRFRTFAMVLALSLGLSAVAPAAQKPQVPQRKAKKVKAAKRVNPNKKFKTAKAPRVKIQKLKRAHA